MQWLGGCQDLCLVAQGSALTNLPKKKEARVAWTVPQRLGFRIRYCVFEDWVGSTFEQIPGILIFAFSDPNRADLAVM